MWHMRSNLNKKLYGILKKCFLADDPVDRSISFYQNDAWHSPVRSLILLNFTNFYLISPIFYLFLLILT